MDLYCWQHVVEQEPDVYNALTRVNKQLATLSIPTPKRRTNYYGAITYMIGSAFHRTDGPALESSTRRCWFYKDKLHRIGGPAVELEYGGIQYWRHGLRYKKTDFAELNKFKIT